MEMFRTRFFKNPRQRSLRTAALGLAGCARGSVWAALVGVCLGAWAVCVVGGGRSRGGGGGTCTRLGRCIGAWLRGLSVLEMVKNGSRIKIVDFVRILAWKFFKKGAKSHIPTARADWSKNY